jgi:CRISPR system Cascade subunit CasD
MTYKYLLLWLEAPLQSWGADSKFGRRDTLPFPTKSGILGLVLCAMGASGEQKDLLARMGPLKQTIIGYARTCEDSDGNPVRLESSLLLRDFHMVGSGYKDGDSWEVNMIPKTSEGKKAVGGGTKMTYRYYLQDAIFAVIFQSPSDLAETFVSALKNPVYDLYLGRKNCVPTEFIFQGIFDDEQSAVQHAGSIMAEKGLMEDFRVLDGEHAGAVMSLNDVPVHFGTVKKYRDRRVTVLKS